MFSRPKLGMLTPELVEGHLEALWRTAEWVDLAESDSAYSRAVIDADDEILLRTAGGVMVRPDLAALDPRYIVTNNARHVRGRNFFGFRVRTAAEFWDELSDARERHLALVQDAEAGDAG